MDRNPDRVAYYLKYSKDYEDLDDLDDDDEDEEDCEWYVSMCNYF